MADIAWSLGEFGYRSFTSLWTCAAHFRCSPDIGHIVAPDVLTLCAMSGRLNTHQIRLLLIRSQVFEVRLDQRELLALLEYA